MARLTLETRLKIYATPLKNPLLDGIAPARTESVGASSPATPSSSASSAIDLSATARVLSNLQNGDNDINAARVDEIRAAITAGQLKIDSSRVAGGLIASVRDLLK